jgi:hypothetical protein
MTAAELQALRARYEAELREIDRRIAARDYEPVPSVGRRQYLAATRMPRDQNDDRRRPGRH